VRTLWTNDQRGRAGSAVQHPDSATKRSSYQLEYSALPRCAGHPLQAENRPAIADTLRWGLVPYRAKDAKIGFKTINARSESVDTAGAYREVFKKRRCLIPAESFYEWKKLPGGKTPYEIGMRNNAPFVFAGLCPSKPALLRVF
jgi:putative SOS response-associated peptidase YedK